MKKLFFDLGDGTSIPARKVVIVLNAENATKSATTRRFLKKMGEGQNAPLPKKALSQINSFVLANAYGQDVLYSSSRRAASLAAEERSQQSK